MSLHKVLFSLGAKKKKNPPQLLNTQKLLLAQEVSELYRAREWVCIQGEALSYVCTPLTLFPTGAWLVSGSGGAVRWVWVPPRVSVPGPCHGTWPPLGPRWCLRGSSGLHRQGRETRRAPIPCVPGNFCLGMCLLLKKEIQLSAFLTASIPRKTTEMKLSQDKPKTFSK